MLEVLTFTHPVFVIITLTFLIMELVWIWSDNDVSAITVAFIYVALTLVLVGPLPTLNWYYPIIYFAGASIWMLIYWYLELRSNRRKLIKYAGTTEKYSAHGKLVDGMWIPNHPTRSSLTLQALLWFLAMPVYLAQDWINFVIRYFTGLMNRIQRSLSVPSEK